MNGSLFLSNRQRARPVNTRHLRGIVRAFLCDDLRLDDFELAIYLVGKRRMVALNQAHLHHAGCTDVITFGYHNLACPQSLVGDIFVCVPEALEQAERFRVDWQCEILRYIVHGVLHLRGFEDRSAAERLEMKGHENRLVKQLRKRFNLQRIGAPIPSSR